VGVVTRPEILIPTDDEGRPIVSVSQWRTFGAADLMLDEQEQPRGCPRQYHRKYVLKDVPPEIRNDAARAGTMLHAALHWMEEHDTGPEEALTATWNPQLPPEMFEKLKEVLLAYLDRGGPMVRFATLGHELDLRSVLYVDDVFGPVMFRGILDWIGLDLEDQSLLHGVDYKSGMAQPNRTEARRSVQLKGYQWLAFQHWDRWLRGQPKRMVMHLDALRWKDVVVRFTQADLEEWHAWAVAVTRRMLRETEWTPRLNDGCAWCPVKDDCSEWLGLPGVAKATAARRIGGTTDEQYARMQELRSMAKLCGDGATQIQEALEKEAATGELELPDGSTWRQGTKWENETDWSTLQTILGPTVWDVAGKGSVAAVKRATKGMDPSTVSRALACVERVPNGTTIEKKKA
jgi:PD-(D/E)XK nuclease superfamily